MLKCRIGLVAECKTRKFTLIISEIFDKDVKANIYQLYELEKATCYLTNFKCQITENSVILDNITDLNIYMRKYKMVLNHKIYGEQSYLGVWKFYRPILYDISCMVKLFDDSGVRLLDSYRYCSKFSVDNVIHCMIVAESDPFTRKDLIDQVVDIAKGRNIEFYILGVKKNMNICILTKRSILARGIEKSSIVVEKTIYQAIDTCMSGIKAPIVYIAVNSDDLQELAKFMRTNVKKEHKIIYIC